VAVQTRVDERMVVGLWERQEVPRAALNTLGLRVIFRGMPSDAGGPDYQDAVVSVAGKRVLSGDVEFHVSSSDWYRHGHHQNHRYNGVILHVVWVDDSIETRREDGTVVPVLALDRFAHLCPTALVERDAGMPTPHPCVAAFAALPTDVLLEEIGRLGEERFNDRAQRFAADLSVEEADQVAYGALLEGLGYASNRRAFAQLADAVPYDWLQSLPRRERLPSLLDAARLGPAALPAPPAHLAHDAWRLAMLRPANHPARRLQGLVALLDRMAPSLATHLKEAVATADSPSKLRNVLVVREGDDAFVGPGRADELVVSVVLPLVAALEPGSNTAATVFDRYPSPPPNRWTRHMLGLLQRAGHDVPTVRTAREHQGLHHLYHAFCRSSRYGRCTVCRMARLTDSGCRELR
jgi:hypothetical protein